MALAVVEKLRRGRRAAVSPHAMARRRSRKLEVAFRIVRLGEVLQNARARHRLSLDEVSRRSGLSIGLISQMERGQGNPSFATLLKLAGTLGIDPEEFFQGPRRTQSKLVRRTERRVLALPNNHTLYEFLTPSASSQFRVLRSSLASGYTNAYAKGWTEKGWTRGEELIHVLRGTLQIKVEEETFELKAGDSLTFDSSARHAIVNHGRNRTEVIVVVAARGRLARQLDRGLRA